MTNTTVTPGPGQDRKTHRFLGKKVPEALTILKQGDRPRCSVTVAFKRFNALGRLYTLSPLAKEGVIELDDFSKGSSKDKLLQIFSSKDPDGDWAERRANRTFSFSLVRGKFDAKVEGIFVQEILPQLVGIEIFA